MQVYSNFINEIYPYLSNLDIRICLMVSKVWKKIIQDYLDNHKINLKPNYFYYTDDKLNSDVIKIKNIKKEEAIQELNFSIKNNSGKNKYIIFQQKKFQNFHDYFLLLPENIKTHCIYYDFATLLYINEFKIKEKVIKLAIDENYNKTFTIDTLCLENSCYRRFNAWRIFLRKLKLV